MELKTERGRVAHLLRRFGLGASEAEVDYYGKGGLQSAIDGLLNYEVLDEGFDVPISKFQQGPNGKIPIGAVQAWWAMRMLATRRPLQEKMTLFWHNHFATSAEKVVLPLAMYQQNEVLRQNATGRFHDLLLQTSQDPAMLFWLDNEFNVKGKPNENFAREVMELFTLGIGHYSERDIQESARAFTGWGIRRVKPDGALGSRARSAAFQFRPAMHDDGEKEFLNNRGNFGGEDVIGILCGNPQTSKFIAKKMWTWFAYENPEPGLIDRLAGDFYHNGLDIKRLARNIMQSDEFYSEKAERRVYKNPVDFVIAPMRQLGIGSQVVAVVKDMDPIVGAPRAVAATAVQSMKAMGMDLLFPPDVHGWDIGPAWVTSATMVERIQFGQELYGQNPPGSKRPQIPYSAYTLFGSQSPVEAVRKLLSIYDVQLPENKFHTLASAAMGVAQGSINESNANQVAATVSRLVFGTPEFQFC